MKKYLAAVAFMLFSSISFAQVQRNVVKSASDTLPANTETFNKKDKKERKERIKELNLSKEQKMKFRDLNRTHKKSKSAIENDATLSATQKQEKLKSLRKDHANQMKTILTPEQLEKFRQSKMDKDN